MNYQQERDEFVITMDREGVPVDVARKVLRHATTLQKIAELSCSSEAADRDRVPCPGRPRRFSDDSKPADCCCDMWEGKHQTVPRIAVKKMHLERRIVALLKPYNVEPVFQGDPRGAVVKLRVPSGKTNDMGREGVCVPAQGFTVAQMERICR